MPSRYSSLRVQIRFSLAHHDKLSVFFLAPGFVSVVLLFKILFILVIAGVWLHFWWPPDFPAAVPS